MHDELALLLQHAEWRSNFDDRTLGRAQAYARGGMVHGLKTRFDDGQYMLTAEVDGSHGERYGCRVVVSEYDDLLVVDTDCRCPVGIDCKHAAAMLMSVAGSAPPVAARVPRGYDSGAGQDAWERWLQTLQPDTRLHTAEPERVFGVILRADSNAATGGLLARPAWLRPGKTTRKELVDPQPLHPSSSHGATPTPAGGWSTETAGALATLLANQYVQMQGNPRWTPIRAAYEEQALEYLLARYPVWFERGSNPLQRGETRKLELFWEESADGTQRLMARAGTDDTRLLHGYGLWYIQPAEGRYGRVDGDARLLERLPQAPALLPAQVAALGRQLQARGLPPPIDRGPAKSVHGQPRPVLHLGTATLARWNGHIETLGVARLGFDYAGIELPPGNTRPIEHRLHDGHLHEIHRDPATEQHAMRQLAALGIAPHGNTLYEYRSGPDQVRNGALLRLGARGKPMPPAGWSDTLAPLEQAGFRLDYARDFPHERLLAIDDWHAELSPSGQAWFDVALGVEVAGERIDLLPVLRQLIVNPAFPRAPAPREKKDARWRVKLDDSRSIELPLARLRALIEPLLEWLEGDPDATPRVHRSQAEALDATGLPWRGDDSLRALLEQLRTRTPGKPPRGFKATLRPYQRDGLAWLDFLGAAGLGGILADDMGLGKTVQVLAHILGEKQRRRLADPALVIAPTSLVGNWQAEAARFAPTLKVLVLHGSDRADRYDGIADHDLVITTYPLLPRDRDRLVEAKFALLVLDEAQAIKNAASQAAQVVREIPATRRLAMTGTPLENHLGELWAQFDAVEPGLLGSQRQFARLYRTPIEKHGDLERQQRLNRRIGPLLLRRRKDEVLTDLPPKTEIVRTLELQDDQRALYETLRLAQHERVRQAVKERGLAQSGIIVLDALLKLRQACCDPRLVKLASAKKVKTSAKLDALLDLLDSLVKDGRRVLLFSQFTEMLALIEAALDKRKLPHQTLTGQTPARSRTTLVKRFQQGDVPLFLISLKAGGVGLNLTAADTVIHYDPWWNPAVEAQATDRAHRIGQDKPVFVYRLICKDTVEEKIQAMQARKAGLAQAVLEGGGSTQRLRFDEGDLEALFGGM
jgi:superfamily II DNA or RNA helicase